MIGVDILKISRIDNIINRFGQKFMTRFFHPEEVAKAKTLSYKAKVAYFAKRFAAKEAFLKSKGHGIDLKFADICIKNNAYGKPIIFYKEAQLKDAEISLSDDGDYAIAFVIIKQC